MKYNLFMWSITLANVVGQKGQLVIEKKIRDKLGVEPGWIALQRLSGDHIEVFFVPPAHRRSLKGSLAGHIKVSVPDGEAWRGAINKAWQKEAGRKAKREADIE